MEIDKKIKFQKVLGVEYLIKMKKYSNTEYLVKSWIMVIMGIAALFVAFLQTIYITLMGNDETKIVRDQQKITDKTEKIISGSCLGSFLGPSHVANFSPSHCCLLFKGFYDQQGPSNPQHNQCISIQYENKKNSSGTKPDLYTMLF